MAGRDHERQRRAQHVEVAVDVHAQHRTPVVLLAVREPGGATDAGDVHHCVERAELVDQLGEETSHCVLVGDGDVRRARLATGFDDPLRGGRLLATVTRRTVDLDAGIDGDHVHPGASELLRDRGADADRTSGDDGDAHETSFPMEDVSWWASSISSANPSKSPFARHSASRSWYPKKSP